MRASGERARRLRVVYFGSGAFGIPTLEMLTDQHDVGLIVSQPAKPAGRGKQLTPTPVVQWATEHAPEIESLTPESVADVGAVARVLEHRADVIVVIAYGQKIPASIYESTACINLHGSLLPKWRGAAPVHHALLGGDTSTGVCVIHVVEKMDAGNVVASSSLAIDPAWTTSLLHDALARLGPACVGGVLHRIVQRQSIDGVVQREDGVFHARKITRDDSWIDFAHSADQCRRRINGLSPSPGVVVGCGSIQFKLICAHTADADVRQGAGFGQIVDVARGRVRCGDGRDLVLDEVQPTGKSRMEWAAFARGYPVCTGRTLVAVQPTQSL